MKLRSHYPARYLYPERPRLALRQLIGWLEDDSMLDRTYGEAHPDAIGQQQNQPMIYELRLRFQLDRTRVAPTFGQLEIYEADSLEEPASGEGLHVLPPARVDVDRMERRDG